jgi:hypothetical protein
VLLGRDEGSYGTMVAYRPILHCLGLERTRLAWDYQLKDTMALPYVAWDDCPELIRLQ